MTKARTLADITIPSGTPVGTTDSQTLTNKTLTFPTIDNPKMGYTTTATAAGTTTFTVTSNHQQFFTGTTTQTIVLPVTSTLALGVSYSIENNSTGTLTVQSSGANEITTIPSGVTTLFTCILTSGTTAASWDYDQIGFGTITGTGANVLGTSPTLTTPTLATPNITTGLTVAGASGTSGQVLTSGGSGAAPTWATVSAGNFGTDLSSVDYTIAMPTALASTATTPRMQTVALTATTEMMLYYSSSSLQAVVFDSSAGTFGTAVLVRSGVFSSYNNVGCIAMSSTEVLVSSLASDTTALQTVVLSVSGSTITVNTAVSTTLAANSSLTTGNNRYVQVGSSYVLCYGLSAGEEPAFRAVTVSGTTPTIGAQYAVAAGSYGNSAAYAYSSTILLSIYYDPTGSTLNALPLSISGTTITAGTPATRACDEPTFVTGLLSTGRIAVAFAKSPSGFAGLISVAGTTASISVAGTTLGYYWLPAMQVFSDQAIIISGASADATSRVYVLTDTSGTPSVGTSVQNQGPIVGYLSSGKILVVSTTSNSSAYYQFGISSGNAVLEKTFQSVSVNNGATTTLTNVGNYAGKYAGPPNSGSGYFGLSIRTSSGKTVSATTVTTPFCVSIDGTSMGKYQQAVAYVNYSITDALSNDTAWSPQQLISSTTTSFSLRKIKIS